MRIGCAHVRECRTIVSVEHKHSSGIRVDVDQKVGGSRMGRRMPRAGGALQVAELELVLNALPAGGGGLQALRGTRRPYLVVSVLGPRS